MNSFHKRPRAISAMRRKAIGVAELAHALQSCMKSVQSLRQALPCLRLTACSDWQYWEAHCDTLKESRKIVIVPERYPTGAEDRAARAFHHRPGEVERQARILDHGALNAL